MDLESFRKAGHEAVDKICEYFSTLPDRDVKSSVQPGEVGKLVDPRPPQRGESFDKVSADFDKVVMPGITHWQHPSFFAYFPANTTYESILADMYATSVSNPGFNWDCSPACTELEVVMMDWVAQMFGLDDSFQSKTNVGGGIILGSASECALTICVAARERALRLLTETHSKQTHHHRRSISHASASPSTVPQDIRIDFSPRLVIYGTDQTHSLGAKAALILGLPFRSLKTRQEDGWGLTGETLRNALEEDQKKGLIPFVLIATIGTTSSGGIDNLAEINQVANDFPYLYVHVDAAWAGVVLSCPEYREEAGLAAVNARSKTADGRGEISSIAVNLHKWGLVAFECSALWIRDRKILTEALDVTPPFLRTAHSDQGTVIDYRNWQLPLGRRFRSLKIYFVLRSYGVEGFQAHIRRGIKLAERLESIINEHNQSVSALQGIKSDSSSVEVPPFEFMAPRRWALLVFRLRPSADILKSNGRDEESALDLLNQRFYEIISSRHDIFLIRTVLGGRFCIRVAVGAVSTKEEHILKAWEVLKESAREALRSLRERDRLPSCC